VTTRRFWQTVYRDGIEGAAKFVKERERPQGERFHYMSPTTLMLAAVLRGATGMSLSEYLSPRLWQAIGAEETALWRADKTGLELTNGNFNVTLRDYGRLGVVLANDGVRPDDPEGKQIVSREYLLEATDARRVPEQFRPGKATPYMGYGYQFWLYPGKWRRFALLGVHGQSMLVDPQIKLVIVQTGANATEQAGETSLGREREALWRGVLRYYDKRPRAGRPSYRALTEDDRWRQISAFRPRGETWVAQRGGGVTHACASRSLSLRHSSSAPRASRLRRRSPIPSSSTRSSPVIAAPTPPSSSS
jgi:CubicO group peptidase (beta-lactamase class C family)